MVGIRRDQVRETVTRPIGQTHARYGSPPTSIDVAPENVPSPRPRNSRMDPGDRSSTRRSAMATGVDVVRSNGVRVRRDINAESRVVPAFKDRWGRDRSGRWRALLESRCQLRFPLCQVRLTF